VSLLGVLFVVTAILAASGPGHPTPSSATTTTTVTTFADGQLPLSGFRATGVWFINESEGWVIGGGCGQERCARFMRTRDAGLSWEPFDPPAIAGNGEADDVSDVRFADARNGWAFDQGLWSTHDSGATWTALDIGSQVLSLETTGPTVYALVASCRIRRSDCHGPVRLFQAAVGSDDWRSVLDIVVGEPSSPDGSLVVSGQSVYALVDDHDLYALGPAGRWERRPVPKSCPLGAVLAAAGPRDLFLSCQTGQGAGGSAPHEFHVSHDGGVHWTRIWEGTSAYLGPIAVTSEGRFLAESVEDLRIDRPDGSREFTQFSYSPDYRCGGLVHALQFVTSRQGFVLTCWELYITRDAGHHWDPIPLTL
jgi:hypothetical protein